MKSIRNTVIVIALLLLAMPSAVWAQEDFAATWTSITIKKDFAHGLGLSFRGEYRSKDNISATDVFFLRFTGSYKPCPYFSIALAYDFLGAPQKGGVQGDYTLQPYLKRQHRGLFDLNQSYKAGQWTFSLRERYLFSHAVPLQVPIAEESSAASANANANASTVSLPGSWQHILRLYPCISYAIPNTRWSPFVAVEFYNSLRQGERFYLQQYHLFAGTACKINPMHTLRFSYVLQHKTPTAPSSKRLHTLNIEYILTIP